MVRETKWTSKLVDGLKKCNALVFNIHGHMMQAPGIPDLLVIHRYWSGFIEVKGEKTRVTPLQKRYIKQCNERGFPAVILRIPNMIEDHNGNLLRKFDGTAIGLIKTLEELKNESS